MANLKAGRDSQKYLLRLPPEIRERLQKEAALNGRSLNSEILSRLQTSIDRQSGVKHSYKVAEPTAVDIVLTDPERTLLAMFKRWSSEKQLALLTLFK